MGRVPRSSLSVAFWAGAVMAAKAQPSKAARASRVFMNVVFRWEGWTERAARALLLRIDEQRKAVRRAVQLDFGPTNGSRFIIREMSGTIRKMSARRVSKGSANVRESESAA